MKKCILICLVLTVLLGINNISAKNDLSILKGKYLGQKPPGTTSQLFAPGIISTDKMEGSIIFFDDGNALLFARIEKITVPKKRWKRSIFIMKRKNNIWQKPVLTKFSDLRYFGDFTTTPDGKTLLVTANKQNNVTLPKGQKGGIGIVKYKNGNLSDIVFFKPPLNMPWDGYPSIANSGKLYFMSEDRGGFGNMDLFSSELKNGKYQEPVNLGAPINTIHRELDPFIAPDESFLIFAVSKKTDGKYKSSDLYICFRKDDSSWSQPINMGPQVNSDVYENRPYITSDGKYLFFNSWRKSVKDSTESADYSPGDIYWIDAKIIEELRPEEMK